MFSGCHSYKGVWWYQVNKPCYGSIPIGNIYPQGQTQTLFEFLSTFQSLSSWILLVHGSVQQFTVNSICSFWQLTSIWGEGGTNHPYDLKNHWTYDHEILTRCQADWGSTKSEKIFDITWLVCKLQTKIPKNPIFRNETSRHTNFTKFCRIVTIDVRNEPWKFQIDISKIGYSTEQSVNSAKC